MYEKKERGLPLWKSATMDAIPGVWHAFTGRRGGAGAGAFNSFNLSVSVGDDPGSVSANRGRLADVAGVNPSLVRFQTQVHGGDVVQLDDPTGNPVRADGFVTARRGVPMMVGVADCVPILLTDVAGTAVGAVHAGWRGVVAGIAERAVASMRERYHVDPATVVAAIGPCIGPAMFEVGDEVAAQFDSGFVVREQGKPHVDLSSAARRQLEDAGVLPANIDNANICTMFHQDLCFSHRGSGGHTGRMAGIIVLA
jgi:polyphenol oxidase